MSEQTTLSVDTFKQQILPSMIEKHGCGSGLQKAIESFTQKHTLLDHDNHPVGVDAMVVSDAGVSSLDEDQVARIVEKTVTQLGRDQQENKARIGGSSQKGNFRGRGNRGFGSFGEFALAVQKSSAPGCAPDSRLLTKTPTTFAHEGVGEAGGFLVPQDWADQIWSVVTGDESLLGRTNQIPTSRNSLSVPVSQSTAWGNTGVQAYWAGQGDQLTQSKPQFEYRNLRLHKLTSLVPASDELLEDVTALDAFIGAEAARALRYKVDDAIINGDGVAKPLGLLNAGAAVTVAKETSQVAGTLEAANIAKLYARMPASSINNAVWLMNQDVLPQLLTMTLGNQPIYLPPNGIGDSPFGTLLGRPVLLSQHAQTLGTRGDIMFVDLTQYLALTKTGGIHASSSMHLWFDYDVTAFRFTFRVGGQPWLSAPITPDNSSDALSPFVTLADRA